jgi:hypothetical protein
MKSKKNKNEGEAFYDSFVENCLGGYEDEKEKNLPMVG